MQLVKELKEAASRHKRKMRHMFTLKVVWGRVTNNCSLCQLRLSEITHASKRVRNYCCVLYHRY